MNIDRCLCLGRSFADLLAEARREGLTLDDLMARPRPRNHPRPRNCAHDARPRCGLCRPYLRETLRTGQITFHQVRVEPAKTAPCQ